jgi:predicted nucleic acid-binding protein
VTRPLTIDASVFVRAIMPAEPDSALCERLLNKLGAGERPVVLPTLVKPEVAGAVRRASGNAELATAITNRLDSLPGVIFVPLDAALTMEAAQIAIKARLRGSDAVYAATARRFDAILVTLNKEQRDRMPADITVCSPAEALEK